tara:strand:+ start:7762 stop:8031 length:270 start_codon:yes stop_codon:yes gene_type:complete
MMGGPNIPNMGNMVPTQFADMTMHMLSPKREIIIDMVMVQLISAILIFMGILMFKSNEITQSDMSVYMIGVFISFILLTQIYQRITRSA